MPKVKLRCDQYLMLVSNYGKANSGVELFCERDRGHSGKHCAITEHEINPKGREDTHEHHDILIYWR